MRQILLEDGFLLFGGWLAFPLDPLADDFEPVEVRGNFGHVVRHVVFVAGLLGVRSVERWET
jgi:hypothetical protein